LTAEENFRMNAFITADLSEEALRRLRGLLTVRIGGYCVSKVLPTTTELISEICDSEILIIEYEDVNRDVIERSEALKIIACCRGTPVNVDIPFASKRGIPVLTARGRNAIAVAEFVFGLLVSLARNIAVTNHLLRNRVITVPEARGGKKADKIWIGDSSPFEMFRGPELCGKVMGIVGYGSIGRRVAGIAKCFGMRVLVSDPLIRDAEIEKSGMRAADLTTVLKESDFLTLHCKASKETENLIGPAEIGLMKTSAFLINTSRGTVVDEKALLQALKEKRIAGAALDVLNDEPISSGNPFLDLDNVLITPHIAGASRELNTHFSEFIVDDIIRLLNNEKPLNIANPEVLKDLDLKDFEWKKSDKEQE